MSHSGLNHLPIEYITLDNTIPLAFVVLGFVQILLYIILGWDNKIYSFFLGSKSSSSIQEQPGQLKRSTVQDGKKNQESELLKEKSSFRVQKHDESICREDVDLVFKSLGIFSHPDQEGERLEEKLDCNDLFHLFEEKEPSEDEVKEAFDVFDENKDGFIDAEDLRRLLCALGLREGSELENCRRMIRAFDENGDDKIDFHEFVKFMEGSFC